MRTLSIPASVSTTEILSSPSASRETTRPRALPGSASDADTTKRSGRTPAITRSPRLRPSGARSARAPAARGAAVGPAGPRGRGAAGGGEVAVGALGVDQVHRRRADEARGEQRRRPLVDLH